MKRNVFHIKLNVGLCDIKTSDNVKKPFRKVDLLTVGYCGNVRGVGHLNSVAGIFTLYKFRKATMISHK